MLPLLFLATAILIALWLVSEIRGTRWMRILAGCLSLLAITITTYNLTRVVIAVKSLAPEEQMFVEASMIQMEALAGSGNITAVTNAIATYNRTLSENPNNKEHYRASLEMSSALNKHDHP